MLEMLGVPHFLPLKSEVRHEDRGATANRMSLCPFSAVIYSCESTLHVTGVFRCSKLLGLPVLWEIRPDRYLYQISRSKTFGSFLRSVSSALFFRFSMRETLYELCEGRLPALKVD